MEKEELNKQKQKMNKDLDNMENKILYFTLSWNIAKYSTTMFWNIFKFYYIKSIKQNYLF